MKGRIINGKYTCIKKISEGGMGTVYLAKKNIAHSKDAANAAIKILHKAATSRHLEDVIRFRNEAMIIS